MNASAEKPPTPETPAAEIRDVPSIRRFAVAADARMAAPDRAIREAECFFQRFG